MKHLVENIVEISLKFSVFVVGSRDELPLERRLMNLVSFVASISALLVTAINIILGLPLLNIIHTVLFTLIFFPIYYLIRFKEKYKYLYGIQMFFILVLLLSGYIFNWGSHGSVLFYFLVFILMIPIYQNRIFRNVLFILSVSSITILFVIEYFYPHLILNTYENRYQRALDVYLGVFFAIITIAYVIRSLSNNYKYERNKVLEQSYNIELMREIEKRDHTYRINFFTNISHELRTPLSLIMAPLEKLMYNDNDEKRNKQYKLIRDNTIKLNQLVDQILDFRKLETDSMEINPERTEIVEFVRRLTLSYSPMADKHQVNLLYSSLISSTYVKIDLEKVEQAISNILNNAFKFTKPGNDIEVILDEKIDKYHCVVIEVRDNGVGIPKDLIKNIFQPFYQSLTSRNGTGLGLPIALEIIKKHKGEITAKNLDAGGSSFIIEIPADKDQETPLESAQDRNVKPVSNIYLDELVITKRNNEAIPSLNQKTLLIVDDNIGIVIFLTESLSDKYKIITAYNGIDGMSLAQTKMPDLIISDIMMPKMDGFELCKELKENKLTNHIPVILLTAKSGDEDKLEGLKIGADDYIRKPFNIKDLESRITNLIENRKLLQNKYKNDDFSITQSDMPNTSVDERFIVKATQVAKSNLHRHDFGVSEFVNEMGISRSSLHTKLKQLTELSASQFLITLRLKRAAEIIREENKSISEISADVGITNTTYFSKKFKEYFGKLPSEY